MNRYWTSSRREHASGTPSAKRKRFFKSYYLENGLETLQAVENLENVFFWGRIFGTKRDYQIALGINYKDIEFFPQLKFYWSYELTSFAPLPTLSDEEKRVFSNFNEYVTGEHDRIVHRFQNGEHSAEEGSKKNAHRVALKEIHLVSALVEKITSSALIPKRSLALDFANCVELNDLFRLKSIEISDFVFLKLSEVDAISVFKFKTAQSKDHTAELDYFKETQSSADEFACETDMLQVVAYFRSLRWGGLVSFARLNTNFFGFVYFGYGLERRDLLFSS